MPLIQNINHYDLIGYESLGTSGVPFGEPREGKEEKMVAFRAKLAFLNLEDGSQDAILPALLKHDAPPKTRIFEYTKDGYYCIVTYEITSRRDELGNVTHFPQAITLAKAHCEEKPGKARRLFNAEKFLALSAKSFYRITENELDLKFAQ